MEDNLEEEKSTLLSNHQNSEDETPSSRKGGLITMPFIIGNYYIFIKFQFLGDFLYGYLWIRCFGWFSLVGCFKILIFPCVFWAVNESFEKVASYGLLPNMIFYLMNVYHLEAARGTIILSLWSSASNILAIFGGFLSDSYLGRFKVIAFGTFCSLLVSQFLVVFWISNLVLDICWALWSILPFLLP